MENDGLIAVGLRQRHFFGAQCLDGRTILQCMYNIEQRYCIGIFLPDGPYLTMRLPH